MTNPDYTAVVLVVDRSGSMNRIASTVQDALEEFVNAQLQEPGKLTIDTVFFDDQVENRAVFVNPAEVKLDLTLNPRGMTALSDAVGTKIETFGQALSSLSEDERPHKVIFVIATDGIENASKEFTKADVAEKIQHQRDTYGWDFTFIGANQDAILAAQDFNIPMGSAITFNANDGGTESVLRSMSTYVSASRQGFAAGYSAEDRIAAVAPNAAPSQARVKRNVAPKTAVVAKAPTAPKASAKPRTPRKKADGEKA